jgi:hypothetical protein
MPQRHGTEVLSFRLATQPNLTSRDWPFVLINYVSIAEISFRSIPFYISQIRVEPFDHLKRPSQL